jgi:hypothetical protein
MQPQPAADIVLAYCRADENQNGAFLEIGAALGAGKQVYLVSDHEWSWGHHPHVRNFATSTPPSCLPPQASKRVAPLRENADTLRTRTVGSSVSVAMFAISH